MTWLLIALLPAQAATPADAGFPFEFRGSLLWVTVNVQQSTRPLHFLLDTGAGVSVVNLQTARRLGLKLGKRVPVRGVASATEGFWPVVASAKAEGVALPGNWLAVNLAALSKACGFSVDGLIGADFFDGRVVQIDFMARKIRLLTVAEKTEDTEVLALKRNRRALLVPLAVDAGKPRWVRLDTGCASALQWVARETREAKADGNVSIGLSQLSTPTTTTCVNLGSQKFESVPTGLHTSVIFPGEAGLLGNGLLSRFERIIIDAKADKLMLQGRRDGR